MTNHHFIFGGFLYKLSSQIFIVKLIQIQLNTTTKTVPLGFFLQNSRIYVFLEFKGT